MRRFDTDALVALALLVISAELFRQTYDFRVPPFATLSPAFWPRLVLLALAVLSMALLARSLMWRAEASPAPEETAVRFSHRNAIICFVLFACFLIALPWLGMLIGGIAFVFLMQELMGPRDMRSRGIHLAVAVLSVGGMWALFNFALGVILPEGVILPR